MKKLHESREIEGVASALFDKIRTRFQNVTLGNDAAKSEQDPEKARFFNFTYLSKDGTKFGNVTVSLIDENSLKVYYGQNISGEMDSDQRAEWYQFLRNLRLFAKRNMLTFDTRDINKSNLDINDVRQQSNVDSVSSKDDVTMGESYINKLLNNFELIIENVLTETVDSDKIRALKELFKSSIQTGIGGIDATSAISPIISDDDLHDAIYHLSQSSGPDADARPIIKKWIAQNKPEMVNQLGFNASQVSTKNTPPETPDTKPSKEYGADGMDWPNGQTVVGESHELRKILNLAGIKK